MKINHQSQITAILIMSLLIFCGSRGFSQLVRINEVMSSNNEYISDDDGSFEDWIEILNPGNQSVNLQGFGLSDDSGDLFKWVFPEYYLQPGEHLLIWASGKDKKPVPRSMTKGIMRNYYPEIPGIGIEDLENHESFPHHPATRQVMISNFDAPADIDDEYGQHLYTWITAPQTGDYRFQIASDDNSQLFIGLDGTPHNLSLIAQVPGWTNPRQWTKYPHQLSGLVHLTQGENYYLSVLMKEGNGGDHVTVRWHLPDGFIEEPISAAHCFIPQARWHTNFRLSSEGETLILTDANGEIIDQMPEIPIPSNVSYGRLDNGDSTWYFFDRPTPETLNPATGAEGITPAPVLSPLPGVYREPLQVTLISPDPQAQLYYTTNGTMPSLTNGTLYQGPFSVSGTRYIRAVAIKTGWLTSEVTAGSFAVANETMNEFSSNLPLILLQGFDTPISPGERTPAYMNLWSQAQGGRNEIFHEPAFSSRIKINMRGSSSMGFPKNGYGFHIINEDQSNRKESLLNLPEEHNWVLHGPYSDKTLMRNALSYAIARDAGHYAPRTRFFELLLHNGNQNLDASHYHGVYVLTERIKAAAGRVEIEKLEPGQNDYPEISGGYIFKIDRLNPGESGFTTARGTKFVWVEPGEQTVSYQQENWLIAWLDSLETALFGPQFNDPQEGYYAFIDTRSFIDMHLITELSKEIDGYRLSTFFHKDRLGKLKSGPLWDFNLSFGNANYLGGWSPNGWYYSNLSPDDYLFGWYTRLFQDPAFSSDYNRRYRSLRVTVFSNLRLNHRIMNNYDILGEAQERNFERWNILGTYIWPNWFIGDTYDDEVMWMEEWVRQRLSWMDSQLGEPFTMLHYWNFNDENLQFPPTWSLGGGQLSIVEGPQSIVGWGKGQQFEANNGRSGDLPATHLRIDKPIGTQVIFHLPSTGYSDPVFSWEARRSAKGANSHRISYSTDGENFLPLDTFLITESPKVYSVDLFGCENVSDNAQLTIKITIDYDAGHPGGNAGNNRFDNIALDAEPSDETIRPPVQTRMFTNPVVMIAGQAPVSFDLSQYFTHPDGLPLQYSIDDLNQAFAGITLNNHQLAIHPTSRGGGHIGLTVQDGHNTPLSVKIYLLVYPEAVRIAYEPFVFDFWSPDEPEGSFPDHMIFLQSTADDPLLNSEIHYAYAIPPDDYSAEDQGNIGFPYRNTRRTRINGLNNNGISFINTGRERDLGSAILAVDTRDLTQAWLTWKASTIIPNSRMYNIRLQYRKNADANWKDWKNADGEIIEYERNQIPGHSRDYINIPFPQELLGIPYLQLRWVYYFSGNQTNMDNNARDMLALNQVKVSALPTSAPDNGSDPGITPLEIFPNPSNSNVIFFNKIVTGAVFDMQGKKTMDANETNTINTSNLEPGVYSFRSNEGETVRFIIL